MTKFTPAFLLSSVAALSAMPALAQNAADVIYLLINASRLSFETP